VSTKREQKIISVTGSSQEIKTGKKQEKLPILLTSQPVKNYQKK
jgi:hypothetical protein